MPEFRGLIDEWNSMDRNGKRKALQPMAEMSQDAIQALEQLKMNDKPRSKEALLGSVTAHHSIHHRHHHQAMTSRSSHEDSEEDPKSVSLSPGLAAAASQMRMRRFANGDDPCLRDAASAKESSGKKWTTTTGRNSFPSKSASSNKSLSSQLISSQSFLWKHPTHRTLVDKRNGCIRSREPATRAKRTSTSMHVERKSSASFSLPYSSSSEANTLSLWDAALLPQLQKEKPFRISPMGYDSRYEDLIYESQRFVDDDVAPEQTAQAIDKCKLWLKKYHVDNYSSRADHHQPFNSKH